MASQKGVAHAPCSYALAGHSSSVPSVQRSRLRLQNSMPCMQALLCSHGAPVQICYHASCALLCLGFAELALTCLKSGHA